MNDQNEKITSFERLAPFMLRSRVVEIGRQRLEQVRKQLAFVLVTDDIAENSRKKALQLFPCPVFQCFSSHDLERFFGCHSTKMLGFRRSPLSSNAMKELKMYKITEDSLHKNPLPERPRVAILGASGIGRHHANWWHLEGAEVCAFLGSSKEKVAATTAKLQAIFPFAGKGYWDLAELLECEKPDIIDVCLPPELHVQGCEVALRAGCHVLCEKPFVYDAALSSQEMISQARALVELAAEKQLMLGICTQYAVAARFCLETCPPESGAVHHFHGRLTSPGANRARGAEQTWIDLSPHMLAAAQVAAPDASPDWNTLKTEFSGQRANAEFVCLRGAGQETLVVQIETHHADEPPLHVRELEFDGKQFAIAGKAGPDGVFQLEITTPLGQITRPDMLRQLIRSFKAGKVEVSGAAGLQNLEWMLKIMGK
ncbi:MAG: Gfo/Idh/MocA family oxidoreductase [Lentisphaeria bacterium]|nr:Gfo/Idh/MocA family oxidoreductase [Lentisphaeria bacterium]